MNTKLASLTAITTAVLAAPLAQADTHNAPGSICQPYSNSSAVYYVNDYLHVSTNTGVICPLTNDGWGGASWAMVVTTGIDNSDPSYVRCTFDGATSAPGSFRNLHAFAGNDMTRAYCYLKAGDRVTSVSWQD